MSIYRYQGELLHEHCAGQWVEEDTGRTQNAGELFSAYVQRLLDNESLYSGDEPLPADVLEPSHCAHCSEDLIELQPNY